MNYYELLQVKRSARRAEIIAAYEKAASLYHPDKYPGNPNFSEEMMSSLNAALSILSDPEKRKKYDDWLSLQIGETYSSKPNNPRKKRNQNYKNSFDLFIKNGLRILDILKAYSKNNRPVVAFLLLCILTVALVNPISTVSKYALYGEPREYSRAISKNLHASCIQKKISSDPNSDGIFSYSDLSYLATNVYKNTEKFISIELKDTKFGNFFEVNRNSCNAVVIIFLNTLCWIVLTSYLIFLLHTSLELIKHLFRNLFLRKVNLGLPNNYLQIIYQRSLPKRFALKWIRYVTLFYIIVGFISYFSSYGANINQKPTEKNKSSNSESIAKNLTKNNSQKDYSAPLDYKITALNLINDVRSKGVSCGDRYFPSTAPLKLNTLLDNAALVHAINMAEMNFFSHTDLSGKGPSFRVDAQGYRWSAVGENIAAGHTSISEAVKGWVKSPGHCSNLMDSRFTEMGIGNASNGRANSKIYWVQILASPS